MTTDIQPTKSNGESGQSVVSRGKEQMEHVTSRAVEGIDSATTTLGRGIERAGTAVEKAGRSAGESAREAGQYMQEASPSKMREDLFEVMGRHPGATLCVGIGAGVVIAQLFRSRGR